MCPAVKPSIQFFVKSSFKLFYIDIDRSELFSYLHHIFALQDKPVVRSVFPSTGRSNTVTQSSVAGAFSNNIAGANVEGTVQSVMPTALANWLVIQLKLAMSWTLELASLPNTLTGCRSL